MKIFINMGNLKKCLRMFTTKKIGTTKVTAEGFPYSERWKNHTNK